MKDISYCEGYVFHSVFQLLISEEVSQSLRVGPMTGISPGVRTTTVKKVCFHGKRVEQYNRFWYEKAITGLQNGPEHHHSTGDFLEECCLQSLFRTVARPPACHRDMQGW